MGNSRKFFLKPVLTVKLVPDVPDPEGFIATYARSLDVYSDEVLQEGANTIIATPATHRYIPELPDCVKACADARRRIEWKQNRPVRRKSEKRDDEPDFDLADKMFVRSEFAREACAGNWQITLHSWIANNRRLPNLNEIDRIRADGCREFEALKRLAEGEGFGVRIVKRTLENKINRLNSLIGNVDRENSVEINSA
jgi:hypothetical protein